MEAMLTPREQRILKAIVHVYITTVEPVASRTISRAIPHGSEPCHDSTRHGASGGVGVPVATSYLGRSHPHR